MTTKKNWVSRIISGAWHGLNFTRNMIFNLLFLIIVAAIISAILSEEHQVKVPQDAVLYLNMRGDVVIQKQYVDPFDQVLKEAADDAPEEREILLKNTIHVIDNAAADKRIKGMVLALGGLGNAGQDKLREIATAIERFKAADKPVYAIGDYYNQTQYYLASHADHVYLNPMGMVLIEGYGRYRTYYKSAFDKLKAKAHVFRVGTYKSAVEPFIRDSMSEAAKAANKVWLDSLWQQYKTDVATARNIEPTAFDETFDGLLGKLAESGNDFAQYALDNGWIDALKDREAIRLEMTELVGSADNKLGFNYIDYNDYLNRTRPPSDHNSSSANIGIVVAKGAIYGGDKKPGAIGGDSTARLLREARLDPSIKAVVLQIDSPGGSAFGSEVIRREIAQLKKAGKPVVASMSSVAASGGYWIAMSADKILASPSTITGSIGIFGMLLTYEDSLDFLGIHTDGVGTTDIVGISPSRTLDPQVEKILQNTIEHGYDQFISLVAKERNMPKQVVDKAAQGRVWIGLDALENGLIDELGTLNDAVTTAAKLANLDDYHSKYFEPPLSAREKFWREFLAEDALHAAKSLGGFTQDSKIMSRLHDIITELDTLAEFNDPRGMYAYCLMCDF